MSRPLSTVAALLIVAATSHVVAQQQGTTASTVTAPPGDGEASARRQSVGALTTIQGNALDSTNGSLAERHRAPARRAVRTDRRHAEHRQVRPVRVQALDPGSYIVEIVANDQTGAGREPAAQRRRRRGDLGGRQAAVPDSAVRGLARAPPRRSPPSAVTLGSRRDRASPALGADRADQPEPVAPDGRAHVLRRAASRQDGFGVHRGRRQRRRQQFVPDDEVHMLDRLAVLYRYRRLCVTRLRAGDGRDDDPGLHATSRCIRRRRGS